MVGQIAVWVVSVGTGNPFATPVPPDCRPLLYRSVLWRRLVISKMCPFVSRVFFFTDGTCFLKARDWVESPREIASIEGCYGFQNLLAQKCHEEEKEVKQ